MSYDALDDFAGPAFTCKDCGEMRERAAMFWTTVAAPIERRTTNAPGRTPSAARRLGSRPTPERTRDFHRKAKYGVEYGTYARLLETQGSKCAICGAPEPADRALHMDHDHDSGQVRGLLCDLCNRGIGYFGDESARIAAAAEYLRRWGK